MPNSPYLPIGEAGRFLGVSIDTLRRWEKTGKITSKRLDGNDRYFLQDDLDRIKYPGKIFVEEGG